MTDLDTRRLTSALLALPDAELERLVGWLSTAGRNHVENGRDDSADVVYALAALGIELQERRSGRPPRLQLLTGGATS
jgi:hypothetical protein